MLSIRGKNNGRDFWHYVLSDKGMIDIFHTSCTVQNVSQYGHIIKIGWGKIHLAILLKAFKSMAQHVS